MNENDEDFAPDDPREMMEQAIELTGVLIGLWPFGQGPHMYGEPLAQGLLSPGDSGEQFLFQAGVTSDPFGIIAQVGREGEPALRTIWLDGEQLLHAMMTAGVAHITGDGLRYVGPEGQDPRAPVTVPDTVPDDLDDG